MDWTIYWFMFPVAIGVATSAMLSGIAGTALFVPIFVIVFPLLGPEFPLGTAAAIGAALMTSAFGFSSGFVGYYRKRLIDFRGAVPFICVSVPVAVAGAVLLAVLKDHETFLKAAYAVLMLVLAPIVFRPMPPIRTYVEHGAEGPDRDGKRPVRTITAHDGHSYTFRAPRLGVAGAAFTGTGAFLTGLLGVGIGEVIMPQLVKRSQVPVPVAAATSVFIVIVTIAAASFAQVAALIAAGGVGAIPWNLVVYTVPAVIIGGQIGPWLQGRIAQRAMERAIAVLFGVIGLAMGWIALGAATL